MHRKRARELAPFLLVSVLAGAAWFATAAHPAAAAARLAPSLSMSAPLSAVGDENELVRRYHDLGAAALADGKPAEARESWLRVLEREPKHLPTLYALTKLEIAEKRVDEALDYAGRFLGIWRYLKDKPADLVAAQHELYVYAQGADPLRRRFDTLKREYVTRLLKLADEQMDHKAWHSARSMLLEARTTDPDHPDLGAGLTRIKQEGGNELAVEDETGGADPLQGVTPEWVAENDPKHADWNAAWEIDTEHYKIKTNAGYRVLKTVARAMEQVQVFYRIFHQYHVKGEPIPVANVLIFKNRDEYKTLGHQPVEWAAGHWDGTNVVTYDARNGGEGGLTGMLDTLFHEASHQFTSLAGGGAVPAWLNEGMASFFEGTKLLSNGKLDWNLVVPGRLYPLLDDMRGKSPHKLEDVIQGHVEDYRVYYPWGWGICYYLYNAEDQYGRLLYRASMKEYFQKYNSEKHLDRFVEFFVTRAKVEGVASISDFGQKFKEFVFALEAEDKGQIDAARRYEERGDMQARLEDWKRAVELYDRSLQRDPDHPEVLWKLALALEKVKEDDRAAGVLRQWMSVTQPDVGAADPDEKRRREAEKRVGKLDASAKRLAEMRAKFHGDSLTLADEYDKQGFPRMALIVLRGPATAQPPEAAARKRYFEVADKSNASLESWRLIFDERTLKGFYGGGEGDFKVQDGVIAANIREDADNAHPDKPHTGGGDAASEKKDTGFAFRRLFIDAQPAGDWSLSAEVRLDEGGRMAGLCFGKKKDGAFRGVAILPEGYVDLGAFGENGKTLLRVKAPVPAGWHRLKIDVAGTRLVAELDGVQVVEYEFNSRAELKGDFGLLAGLGKASFRDIKMLDYDPNLPRRAKIGHRRAAPTIEAGATKALERAEPGRLAYMNSAPPLLRVQGWIGTAPHGGDLEKLRYWPVVLVFWTTIQEDRVPVLPGLAKLAEQYKDLDIPILLLSNEKKETIQAWVAAHPVSFPIAYDYEQQLYQDYAIAKLQLPHAKLIGLDGSVVWEGNPDYKAEYGSYLDEPLADMVAKSKLTELRQAQKSVADAEAALQRGEFAAAIALFQPVSKIDAVHPAVAAARDGLARIESEGDRLIGQSDAFAKDGRQLQAAKVLEDVMSKFTGIAAGEKAKRALEKLSAGTPYKNAKKLDNRVRSAEKSLEANKLDAAREMLDGTVPKLEAGSDPWVKERLQWLVDALKSAKDGKSVLAAYKQHFPGA